MITIMSPSDITTAGQGITAFGLIVAIAAFLLPVRYTGWLDAMSGRFCAAAVGALGILAGATLVSIGG